MVVFLFYFVALLALWFLLPVFFHQSVILYVIYTVWIIAWFHALLCWGFLTDLCLLDTNEWLYCLYSDCLTQLMRCGCLVFTWAQSVLSFFNCCKDPKKRLSNATGVFCCCNSVRDMYWFPSGVFCCGCSNSNFFIVQRKLFDKWFTSWFCVSIYTLYIGFFFFSFLMYLIWNQFLTSLFNTFNIQHLHFLWWTEVICLTWF